MIALQKKTISVMTATRSEYGLLKPVILKLMEVPEFNVNVIATGMHLSPEFGLTYKEIVEDGIQIDEKIEILLSSDTPTAISKTMGLAMINFADYFARLKPDMLLVLGDRYEALAVCCVAMNQRIPIAHMHGGETTEGCIDESIRHAITKLSYLHFTSTEEYKNRVIQLGEQPERVFCVGAIGVENVIKEALMSKSEMEESINFILDKPYAVVTYHPVTLEGDSSAEQFQNLLDVCSIHKDMMFIFCKANADAYGRVINQMIDDYVKNNNNAIGFISLGTIRYLSAVKYSTMVIGNSSSGIIEVPSLGIPTINIGDRQKGRLHADSVINCRPSIKEIESAITLALSASFKKKVAYTINPYEMSNTSDRIVEVIKEYLLKKEMDLKKKFYDLKR